jgi:putative transposase
MRETGLSARQRRGWVPSTTDSRHDLPIAPNLLARTFSPSGPTKCGWPMSYLPTDEGWLYLATSKIWRRARLSAGRWLIT